MYAGNSADFWVVACTPESITQKLKPDHHTVRLLTKGTAVEREQTSLTRAPLSSFAIYITKNDMSQTMLRMGLSGAQCFNISGPVLKPINPHKNFLT